LREQREQRRNRLVLLETTINAVLPTNTKQHTVGSTVVGGKKRTMNTESAGGGVKIETDETKKVHLYVHGDGPTPNCVLNTRDLSTVV